MSEDRWTYPAEGDSSPDIDREATDPEAVAAKQQDRAVTHPQQPQRSQGTTADAPGVDPADREVQGGQPTFEG